MSRAEVAQLDWPVGWPPEKGLYEMALGIAHRRDPAMDLCSEATLRGLKEAASGKVLSKSWFRRVMKNAWTDTLRRNAPYTQDSIAPERGYEIHVSQAATPEEDAMRMETAERLLLSVQAMAPRQRDVLTLRYFKGKTVEAIAKELGIAVSTVERAHKEALLKMGTLMEDQRGAVGAGVGVLASATKLRLGDATKAAGTAFAVNSVVLVAAAVFLGVITALMFILMDREEGGAADLEAASLNAPSVGSEGEALAQVPGSPPTPTEGKRAAAGVVGEGGSGESQIDAVVQANSSPAQPENASASVVPSRTFGIQLKVDGQNAKGWIAKEPLLEPDGHRASGSVAPRCIDFTSQGEAGLFTFELPEAAGSWLFTFEDPKTWSTVWLIDPGGAGVSRRIEFDTGSVVMESPEVTAAGLKTSNAVLVGNPEPGVWVVSPCQGADPTTGAWLFEGVLAGSVHLMAIRGLRHPDDWEVKAGPWVVPTRETLRLP